VYTYIRYKGGVTSPTNRTDGVYLCNTTLESGICTGLDPDAQYAFSAWTWYIEDGIGQWSDNYSTCNAYTGLGAPTGLGETAAGGTWINLSWAVGADGAIAMLVRNESGYAC